MLRTGSSIGRKDLTLNPANDQPLLPVLVVLHQGRSSPGRVGQLLQAKGYRLDIRRPCFGQPLPETLDEHAGAVVFGGPMSANDDHLEFIRAELNWLAVPLAEKRPLLGICLGAQLLARHLGSSVKAPDCQSFELGYHPIITEAGAGGHKQPPGRGSRGQVPEPANMLGGAKPAATVEIADMADVPAHVFQWHGEGFELPSGARRTAAGSGPFPNQAFAYGPAKAVQFHPEMTYQMLCRWTTLSAERLAKPGTHQRDRLLSDHIAFAPAVTAWLDAFLDDWLDGGGLAGGGPSR